MPDATAPAYGIATALTWGSGDFAGGLATKRNRSVHGVVLASQAIGLLVLPLLALLVAEPVSAPRGWLLGALAGLGSALGVSCLYAALALGRMGIAAPITAVLSAAIPVLFGALREGLPEPLRILGFALALLGVWLLTRPESPASPASAHHAAPRVDPETHALARRALALALLSGVGFGLLLTFLGEAGAHGTYWPLVSARMTSIGTILLIALLAGHSVVPARPALGLALVSGVLEIAGNVTFVLAAQTGRLDVAAVLSSLYPAATVLLAAVVLKERMTRVQLGGVAVVLGSIPLIVL